MNTITVKERYINDHFFFFFQAEDGIRDLTVTGVQTCALPISSMWDWCASSCCGRRRWWDDDARGRNVDARAAGQVREGSRRAAGARHDLGGPGPRAARLLPRRGRDGGRGAWRRDHCVDRRDGAATATGPP